jgi:hypothetical protein
MSRDTIKQNGRGLPAGGAGWCAKLEVLGAAFFSFFPSVIWRNLP